MTFTTALFDFIGTHFKDVARRLADAYFFQLRPLAGKHFFPIPFEAAADFVAAVLRGRDDFGECGYFRVQVSVVEGFQHLAPYEAIQPVDIDGASADGIGGTARAHLDHVVVPVPKRVVALAVELLVLFLTQLIGVKAVAGGELVTSGYAEHARSPQ